MKFGLFGLPTIPGTLGERRRLRPIAHQTERWQTMFDEVVELTRIAEDLGFAYFARQGVPGVVFKYLFSHFGFGEAFREPADEAKWPQGKVMMPVSECTVERMERATYIYCGTVADLRRRMDELVEAADPEDYFLGIDQGLVPFEIVKQQLRIFGEQVAPHYMN